MPDTHRLSRRKHPSTKLHSLHSGPNESFSAGLSKAHQRVWQTEKDGGPESLDWPSDATSDSLKRPLITYFYITHVTLSSMHASRETIQPRVLRSCFILKIDSCGEDYIYRAPYKGVDERPIHTTLLLSLQDHIEQRVCQDDTIEHFTQSSSSPFSPTPAPPLLHHNRWYNSNIAISST